LPSAKKYMRLLNVIRVKTPIRVAVGIPSGALMMMGQKEEFLWTQWSMTKRYIIALVGQVLAMICAAIVSQNTSILRAAWRSPSLILICVCFTVPFSKAVPSVVIPIMNNYERESGSRLDWRCMVVDWKMDSIVQCLVQRKNPGGKTTSLSLDPPNLAPKAEVVCPGKNCEQKMQELTVAQRKEKMREKGWERVVCDQGEGTD